MAAKFVVFRCDASPEIGGGHIARCLVVADSMRARGWTCCFATTGDGPRLFPSLAASGHEIRVLDESFADDADEAKAISSAIQSDCELLVIDHYGRDLEFERAARGWTKRIAVIDDLARRKHDTDVLVDPTPGRGSAAYRQLVPIQCQLLLGPLFAPLRLEFQAIRAETVARRRASPELRRVFVGFGATDSKNMTAGTVTKIGETLPNVKVDVVLGAGAAHSSDVKSAAEPFDGKVRIHIEPKSMSSLMAAADLGVGAAGMMSWERCCLGLPSLVSIVAENQRSNAIGLERAGAGVIVGDEGGLDLPAFVHALKGLAEDSGHLAQMAESAASICDGRGAGRVAEALAA